MKYLVLFPEDVCIVSVPSYAELQDVMEGAGFILAAGVAAIAEHSIMRKFAAGCPNERDEKELGDFAVRIRSAMDSKTCISCMRCIAVCPQRARSVSKTLLAAGSMKLKKACSGYKENELFL